jgi:hypothetical protein
MNLMVARKLLANMPDDVFHIYIAPLIEAHGWPFDLSGNASNLAEARRWFLMFDRQRIETIRQLTWERESFPFSFGLFHPNAQNLMKALIDHHSGIAFYADLTNVTNSRDKFFSARDYIARTGQMPIPVVLQNDMPGLRILDGNHRLAAMASFTNANAGMVDAWIGTLYP